MASILCCVEGRGRVESRLRGLLLSCPEVWVGGHGLLPRRTGGAQQPWRREWVRWAQSSPRVPQPWLQGAEGCVQTQLVCGILERECGREDLSTQDPPGAAEYRPCYTDVLLPSRSPGTQLVLKNCLWGSVSSHSRVHSSIPFDHGKTSQLNPLPSPLPPP